MKAVILCAGKSTRTYPITLTRPKPLIKVGEKTIIEYNLEALGQVSKESDDVDIDEIVLVVGYKKAQIKEFLGNEFDGIKLKYVDQKEQKGTAHALLAVEKSLEGRFILMMGDNIYSGEDILNCVKWHNSMLTAKVPDPQNYGVIVEKGGFMEEIVEKPEEFVSDLINAALYVLDIGIFSFLKKVKESERNELEIIDALKPYSADKNIKLVDSKLWLPIGYPHELLIADKKLRNEENLIGKGSKVEGEVINSNIGKNCVIKGSVKDSIILDNCNIEEGSEITSCVVGQFVKFSGKAYGAVIGDNVYAKNVAIVKGVKVWPNRKINGLIEENIE